MKTRATAITPLLAAAFLAALPAAAAELLANGSFDTADGWTVIPPQTAWTCIASGEASLHPPDGYTGPILSQDLSVPHAGGRKLRFSAVMSKTSAPAGGSIAFVVNYQDAAGDTRQAVLLQPDNDAITEETAVSSEIILPLGARTLTGFGVRKDGFGSFTLQSASLDLPAPPLAITSPAAGTTIDAGDPLTVNVSLDAALTGARSVEIHDQGVPAGGARPDSFVHGWRFPDDSIMGFQSATMFNYVHEDEYFFFTGAFANQRFAGDFSAHTIGGMATGSGTLDFSFDTNGLLKVATTGDAPLGIRSLSGGKSTTCLAYQRVWTHPPAGNRLLRAVVTVTDPATGLSEVLASEPVALTVTGPATVPEIAVDQPLGSALADGASTRKFGEVGIGSDGALKTFIIRNTGNAPLTGLAVSKNGVNAADFKIVTQPKASLAPGAATSFQVRFDPSAKGARGAAIHIASNDADENPFDIALAGTGVNAPEIAVEQPAGSGLTDASSKKSFGTVKVGRTGAPKTFTIRNKGSAKLSDLAVTLAGAQASDFVVTQPVKTTLAPGAATTFKVSFKPKAKGTRNATIRIKNNDANENPFRIQVTGGGA